MQVSRNAACTWCFIANTLQGMFPWFHNKTSNAYQRLAPLSAKSSCLAFFPGYLFLESWKNQRVTNLDSGVCAHPESQGFLLIVSLPHERVAWNHAFQCPTDLKVVKGRRLWPLSVGISLVRRFQECSPRRPKRRCTSTTTYTQRYLALVC